MNHFALLGWFLLTTEKFGDKISTQRFFLLDAMDLIALKVHSSSASYTTAFEISTE